MLFLKRLFGTGKPAIIEETSDRVDYDVSTNITPEKIDQIMTSANTGDTEDQCRLSREILEKNADIMQALSTRKNAVIGSGWRMEPGDDSGAARMAAEQLQTALRACGGDGSDAFEDLLEDLLGALLPGRRWTLLPLPPCSGWILRRSARYSLLCWQGRKRWLLPISPHFSSTPC